MLVVDELPKSEYYGFDDEGAYSKGLIVRSKPLIVEPPGIFWKKRAFMPGDVFVVTKAFLHPDTKEFGWVVKTYEQHLIDEVTKSMLEPPRQFVWTNERFLGKNRTVGTSINPLKFFSEMPFTNDVERDALLEQVDKELLSLIEDVLQADGRLLDGTARGFRLQ